MKFSSAVYVMHDASDMSSSHTPSFRHDALAAMLPFLQSPDSRFANTNYDVESPRIFCSTI
jgi:hypothetical protein